MLQSYRVLDLTDEKGPLCAQMLGSLGADVIKVEPPRGDPSRRLGPYYHSEPHPNKSLYFFSYNTNKRSVTANLATNDGRELFRALVATADLVVESFAPGYLPSLGLGYGDLKKLRHGLVMTSITPFGQTGPDRGQQASDLILLARGGLLALCGEVDGPPSRVVVPQSYCQGGAQGGIASILALHLRDDTGAGQHIDVSIQEAVLNALISAPQSWDMLKLEEGRGSKQQRGAVVGKYVWEAKDGYVNWCWWVAPGWGRKTYPLLEWMSDEGEVEDLLEVDWEGKSTADLKQAEVDHWEDVFARFLKKHTKKEIYEQALKRRIMLFPTYSMGDLTDYVQLEERKYYTPVFHPELKDTLRYPGPFVQNTGEPFWSMRRRPPVIGEHNAEIYGGELGLTSADLASLKAEGAI